MFFLKGYRDAKKLIAEQHRVIFYAENRFYHQYFEQLLNALLLQGIPVLYITSDKNDPLLSIALPGLRVVYVHWWAAFVLARLKADVCIMTMPDLDNYIFKRAGTVGCYIYVFHAMVSTHQQYTTRAFYHYDAIFCPGPAHGSEIRSAENLFQLKKKDIVTYGYPLIDALKEKARLQTTVDHQDCILIAPSWYNQCIFETCMDELVQQLSVLPFKIIIRPHPEYVKRRPQKMMALKQMAEKFEQITFDYSPDPINALLKADILITDRSGIAFEFALGLQKPVLFIDTPPKIMNAEWEKIGSEPIENKLRSTIGIPILPEELYKIKDCIDALNILKINFPATMETLQKSILFSNETSNQTGVDYILSKVKTID